jgi:hypothetical protein
MPVNSANTARNRDKKPGTSSKGRRSPRPTPSDLDVCSLIGLETLLCVFPRKPAHLTLHRPYHLQSAAPRLRRAIVLRMKFPSQSIWSFPSLAEPPQSHYRLEYLKPYRTLSNSCIRYIIEHYAYQQTSAYGTCHGHWFHSDPLLWSLSN